MATCSSVKQRDKPNVKKDIKCTICEKTCVDLHLLPCLDSFCKPCIIKSTIDGKIVCPSCDAHHSSDLMTQNTLLADEIQDLKIEEEKNQCNQCCLCEEKEVASFCNDCNGYLCCNCINEHNGMPSFANHSLCSQDVTPIEENNISQNNPFTCHIHKNNLLKVYCETCQVVVCTDCALYSHQSHTFRPAELSTSIVKDYIALKVPILRKQLDSYKKHNETVENFEYHILDSPKKLKEFIQEKFDHKKELIDRRQEELFAKIDAVYDEFAKVFEPQNREVKMRLQNLEVVLNFAECIAQCDNDIGVAVLGGRVLTLMKELENISWSPTEMEKLGCLVFSQPKTESVDEQFLSTLGKLTDYSQPISLHPNSLTVLSYGYVDDPQKPWPTTTEKPVEFDLIMNRKMEIQIMVNNCLKADDEQQLLYPPLHLRVNADVVHQPSNQIIEKYGVDISTDHTGVCKITFDTLKIDKYLVIMKLYLEEHLSLQKEIAIVGIKKETDEDPCAEIIVYAYN